MNYLEIKTLIASINEQQKGQSGTSAMLVACRYTTLQLLFSNIDTNFSLKLRSLRYYLFYLLMRSYMK